MLKLWESCAGSLCRLTHAGVFLLGTSPAGYDIAETPGAAEDYIEWATGYFSSATSDKASSGPFALRCNHTGDYEAFGQAAAVGHIVPIVTQRSAEVTMLPLLSNRAGPGPALLHRACNPRLFCVTVPWPGSSCWAGLEEGQENYFLDLPEHLHAGVAEIFDKVEGEKIAFPSKSWVCPTTIDPRIVPLAHLGGASGGKDARRKGEAAVARARRGASGGSAPVSVGGAHIGCAARIGDRFDSQ